MIPFTIALKTIKYVGINLSKWVKVLYSENYKTRVKEIKDTNKRYSMFMDWMNQSCLK